MKVPTKEKTVAENYSQMILNLAALAAAENKRVAMLSDYKLMMATVLKLENEAWRMLRADRTLGYVGMNFVAYHHDADGAPDHDFFTVRYYRNKNRYGCRITVGGDTIPRVHYLRQLSEAVEYLLNHGATFNGFGDKAEEVLDYV